jgi:hypothetical protein
MSPQRLGKEGTSLRSLGGDAGVSEMSEGILRLSNGVPGTNIARESRKVFSCGFWSNWKEIVEFYKLRLVALP